MTQWQPERIDWWHSENRIARLKSLLFDEGKSTREVAGILGTTKNAVIGKATRLGWSTPVAVGSLSKPRRYAFDEIGPRDCRFPFGDPHKPDFRFCGARVVGFRPYCVEHMAIAWGRRVDD